MDDPTIECLFDRLRSLRERAADADDVARALVARISGRLSSHDKSIRQSTLEKLWSKSSGAIQMLLSIFENSKDAPTIAYIASIFRETLCLKQGKSKKCSANNELSGNKKKESKKCFKENKSLLEKRANNLNRQQCVQVFVTLNGTQAVVRAVLANNSRREGVAGGEQLLSDLIWILASLATKDPKFATKVRMLGCVRILHYILKGHMTDNKFIFPLLVVIKQLTKNPITVSILIRDGIAATYERALATLGCIPTVRLRLCLAGIAYMSKNKVCCMQIVKTGLCNVLLRVFDHWDRYQDRARLKICAHVLQTLLHLCNIKSGRRALCTKKHVQALHRFCMQCPDEPEFDKLLAQVCAVITLCLKHQELPVPPTSPATFNLTPILKGTRALWPCKDDDDYDNNSDDKSDDADFEDLFPDLEGTTEFTDDTDDTDFQKDDAISKSGDSLQNSMWLNSAERDIDDLKKYTTYFKEFGPYNKQPRASKSRSNSRGSILDDFRSSQANTKSVSSSLLLPVSVSRESEHNPTQTKSNPSKLYETLSSASTSSLKIYKDISRFSSFEEVYTTLSSRVRSVIPFAKVAYPDLNGGHGLCKLEPLNVMERGACRAKLLSCVERAINPDSFQSEVVYDLDQICNLIGTSDKNGQKSVESQLLSNSDELDVRKSNSYPTHLTFESRFESGNLRKAIQIGPREYELILMPDVNSPKRHQWFYFEVRNMQQGRPYIFNIINCEKSDSQFNFGMKPVLYSVKEAIFGRPGWVRAGSDICYYRNSYHYARQKHNKCYLTVTFNITFPHNNDVCYLAYHFPYTYSMLMTRIWQLCMSLPVHTHLRAEPLCYSLNNNEVPLLTVTAEDAQTNPIAEREVIFLTARVHPGESNASWVMDGTLCRLLADTPDAAELRSKYVFKIVPMLNVEGVINGCHRCGLTNEDLNRRWCKPSPILHPSIYHTKGLMEYMVRVWRRPPFLFCDYHGHSRKKNVFLYGCCAAESWCPRDRLLRDEPYKYLMLPALMHRDSPAFSLASCSFRVERERESTARVAVWRQLGVARSYTMEASFCGFDRGPFKGYHLNTKHLQNVGEDLCEALNGLDDTAGVDLQFIKDLNGNIIDISFKRKEVSSEGDPDSDVATGTDSVLRTDSEEDFD